MSTIIVQDSAAVPVVVTDNTTVTVEVGTPTVVVSGMMGPPGPSGTITGSGDIDLTGLTDGATLVYSAETALWRATNKLDNQILEAGQF